MSGGGGGGRTHDPLIKSQLLYQLSYASIFFGVLAECVSTAKKMERAKGLEPSTFTLAR